MALHHGNPFGVVRNWFTLPAGPGGGVAAVRAR